MGEPQRNVVDLVVDGVPCRVPFSEQTIRLCHDLLAKWTSRQRELGRRMVIFLAARVPESLPLRAFSRSSLARTNHANRWWRCRSTAFTTTPM
jgi:hypothetical protein